MFADTVESSVFVLAAAMELKEDVGAWEVTSENAEGAIVDMEDVMASGEADAATFDDA